jgi:hypothetical protein
LRLKIKEVGTMNIYLTNSPHRRIHFVYNNAGAIIMDKT